MTPTQIESMTEPLSVVRAWREYTEAIPEPPPGGVVTDVFGARWRRSDYTYASGINWTIENHGYYDCASWAVLNRSHGPLTPVEKWVEAGPPHEEDQS